MDTESPAIPEKPRRWRFQFGLRMMFLVTTLAAVLLSWWRTKQDIRNLEAVHDYYATYEDGIVHITNSTDLLSEKAIADSLTRVAYLGPVKGIKIIGDFDIHSGDPSPIELTAGAWDYLRRLKLKSLSVWGLGDRSVPQLAGLSSLEELTIITIRKRLTPAGEKRLREELPNCKITIDEQQVERE